MRIRRALLSGICVLLYSVAQANPLISLVGQLMNIKGPILLYPLSPPKIGSGEEYIDLGFLVYSSVISPDDAFVYYASYSSIYMYARNPATNALTPLSPLGASYVGGGSLESMRISPDGKYLYGISSNSKIEVLSRDLVTGQLTSLFNVATGSTPKDLWLSPDGGSLYVVNSGAATLSQFSRNVSTGQLTPLSPATVATGTTPFSVRVSPDGLFAYVTNNGSATISMFARDPGTGLLTPLSPGTVATGTQPRSLTISPDGKSLYATLGQNPSIHMFGRDAVTGLLTPLSPAMASASIYACDLALSPDGAQAYVSTCSSDSTLFIFNRNPTSGVLTSAGSAKFSYMFATLKMTSDGTGIYSHSSHFKTAVAINRNTTTGAVSSAFPDLPSRPDAVALSPDDAFLYAVNQEQRSVTMYSRNAGTGQLTKLSPANVATATSPVGIVLSPDGISAYVINQNSSSVSMFSRNGTTGQLTPMSPATASVGGAPQGLTVSPDGKFVYVSRGSGGMISMFSRNTSTGLLSAATNIPVVSATALGPLTISPNGDYLYVANGGFGAGIIWMFSRNPANGALTELSPPTIATGSLPKGIVVSPDGQNLYVANSNNSTVTQYARDVSTGQLTSLSPASLSVGNPNGITASSDGKSVYVVRGSVIQMYDRTAGGTLTSVGTPPTTGNTALAIVLTADGKHAYVACSQDGVVSMFERR